MKVPWGGRLLLLALFAAGCGYQIGFGRKVSDEENILRVGLHSYYDEAAADFAAGNADALTELFDPAIAVPMTREQIRAWAQKFFQKHGPAHFIIQKLDIERVGHVSAVVTLSYRVETRDGEGSFGGMERDELVQRHGHWYITSWEKL